MRIPGYCTGCRRFRPVINVSVPLPLDIQSGLCDICLEAQQPSGPRRHYRKGDRVIGLGRGGRHWQDKPVGTVVGVVGAGSSVRVQWDRSIVEDEMQPADLLPA